MGINSYADFFKQQTDSDTIIKIETKLLKPFGQHPFKVTDDEDMEKLVDSIKEKGVINPIIVRVQAGGYEILSGHRRTIACKKIGIKEIPAIVRNLDDDEATILMVDSNIYREKILPSEKAFAYLYKQKALKHQGKEGTTNTNEEIGKALNDNARTVQRYIRLSYLNKSLLEMVDNNFIKIIPAVELSYLTEEQQEIIDEVITDIEKYPSLADTKKIRSLENITYENIAKIISKETKTTNVSLKLPTESYNKYFEGKTKKEIQEQLTKIIEQYFNN